MVLASIQNGGLARVRRVPQTRTQCRRGQTILRHALPVSRILIHQVLAQAVLRVSATQATLDLTAGRAQLVSRVSTRTLQARTHVAVVHFLAAAHLPARELLIVFAASAQQFLLMKDNMED